MSNASSDKEKGLFFEGILDRALKAGLKKHIFPLIGIVVSVAAFFTIISLVLFNRPIDIMVDGSGQWTTTSEGLYAIETNLPKETLSFLKLDKQVPIRLGTVELQGHILLYAQKNIQGSGTSEKLIPARIVFDEALSNDISPSGPVSFKILALQRTMRELLFKRKKDV